MEAKKEIKTSFIKKILDKELHKDANSFCIFLYQPKEPAGLEKFKKRSK